MILSYQIIAAGLIKGLTIDFISSVALAALCSAGCNPLDHLEICASTNLKTIQWLTSCATQCSGTEDEHSLLVTPKGDRICYYIYTAKLPGNTPQ